VCKSYTHKRSFESYITYFYHSTHHNSFIIIYFDFDPRRNILFKKIKLSLKTFLKNLKLLFKLLYNVFYFKLYKEDLFNYSFHRIKNMFTQKL